MHGLKQNEKPSQILKYRNFTSNLYLVKGKEYVQRILNIIQNIQEKGICFVIVQVHIPYHVQSQQTLHRMRPYQAAYLGSPDQGLSGTDLLYPGTPVDDKWYRLRCNTLTLLSKA